MTAANDPSRRDFLANLAALGAGALVAGAGTMQAQANPRRLDLHHHFVSPGLAKKASEVRRQGWETLRDYTPQATIEKMDKAGIQTGFCSLTTPGIWMGDDFRIERADALRLAREMNEFAAKMMSDYKGRFGLFTVLPMPTSMQPSKKSNTGSIHSSGWCGIPFQLRQSMARRQGVRAGLAGTQPPQCRGLHTPTPRVATTSRRRPGRSNGSPTQPEPFTASSSRDRTRHRAWRRNIRTSSSSGRTRADR